MNEYEYEYINDIKQHGGEDYIIHVNSQVGTAEDGRKQNMIRIIDILNVIVEKEEHLKVMKEHRYTSYEKLQKFIYTNYSWKTVSGLICDYLTSIANSQ